MNQFSINRHQQDARPWFEHPLLVLLLPYSVRAERFTLDEAAIRRVFASDSSPWQQVAVRGLAGPVQRRYSASSDGERLRIGGPYGYKAWTMTTLVAVLPDGDQTRLSFRTFPHRDIVLNMLTALAFTCVFAAVVGVPGAPWFPFLFFGPFLYVATVIATKVEALGVVALVSQALQDEATRLGSEKMGPGSAG